MSDKLKEALEEIRREGEMRGLMMENARLRQAISCAMCAVCGEEIADQDWTIDEDDRLVHKECEGH
jgi:hypothetical protein